MQWYFSEMNFENIYAINVENEEIVNLELEGFIEYL
jgi:hypothetical protein